MTLPPAVRENSGGFLTDILNLTIMIDIKKDIRRHCINCRYWGKTQLCTCDLHEAVTLGSDSCENFKIDNTGFHAITVASIIKDFNKDIEKILQRL